jgi:Amt family ammonium transporter
LYRKFKINHSSLTKNFNLMKSKLTVIPFLLLIAISIYAVFFPGLPSGITPTDPDVLAKFAAINTGDVAWVLTATALVLFMTPGLALFYGGMVNSKNIITTMLQSFICMGIISIVWVVVGFSIAFGDSQGGLFGDPRSFFMLNGVLEHTPWALAPTIPMILFVLFQLKFAIITPALITGSFSERIRFTSYVLFICLFSIFIYAPLAHWAWHPEGWLFKMGVLDFAGGTVVHISAGCAALAAALYLGKRKEGSEENTPANIPFVLLGTAILWFGWFGFNAGSALGANTLAVTAFATTNTAAAAAGLAWIFFDGVKGKKPTAIGFCIGAVVGLVAITPAAGYVSIPVSIFIGVLASIISNQIVGWRAKSTLDDTLDVFPCHGVGGMTGMLLTGLFASKLINTAAVDGLFNGGGSGLFVSHVIALVAVASFAFFGSLLLLKITDLISPLRVSEEEKEIGLDITQHGEETLINKVMR